MESEIQFGAARLIPEKPGTLAGREPVLVNSADYWNALIGESEAASFLGLVSGTLANKRQDGSGPRFIRISARCVKYRRCDLQEWCNDRLRSSTSDPGPDMEAA